jgi:hypothetical protein
MKITSWKRILALSALCGCQSLAVGVPHFKLDDIVNAADLIVVADVSQIRDLGPAQPVQFRNQRLQAEAYSTTLSVRRTLKGPLLPDISVTYSLPVTFLGYSGLSRGIRMVFLRRDSDQYHLADPYYSNFPATSEPPGENTSSSNSSQSVLSNMLAVLASATTSNSEKYEILRVDYVLPSNEKTIAALRKGLSASTDRELNEQLQGQLIRFGDLSELSAAANLLSSNSATQSGRQWLLYVIGNEVKDARAIPRLKPLLSSSDNSVREAAVEALWHIAVPDAVPALVQKLQDPDENVQFYAVRGLSDITNEYGWGGPSEREFHQHAQKYLTHWQEWAKNRAP